MAWHKWWGPSQWAAYLEHKDLPVKASSKRALAELEERWGDLLAAKELAGLILDDPLFALRLLKEANQSLPRRMARDITTPLGIILALGTQRFAEQLEQAPEIDESHHEFFAREADATLAARIAMALGSFHYDLDPGELGLAALLASAGEIELWAFAPELPQAAADLMRNGVTMRSEEAQVRACGFAFLELTLLMCEHWQLPPLILQLIRGDQNVRARLARLAVAMARHLGNGANDPALPHDVLEAAGLTGGAVSTIVAALPGLNDEEKSALASLTEEIRAGQTE